MWSSRAWAELTWSRLRPAAPGLAATTFRAAGTWGGGGDLGGPAPDGPPSFATARGIAWDSTFLKSSLPGPTEDSAPAATLEPILSMAMGVTLSSSVNVVDG